MTDWKKAKDAKLFDKEIQKDPALIAKSLKAVFGQAPESGAEAQPKGSLQFLTKKRPHLDQSVIKRMVGQGYIEPVGGNRGVHNYSKQTYRITSKGLGELRAHLPETADPATA